MSQTLQALYRRIPDKQQMTKFFSSKYGLGLLGGVAALIVLTVAHRWYQRPEPVVPPPAVPPPAPPPPPLAHVASVDELVHTLAVNGQYGNTQPIVERLNKLYGEKNLGRFFDALKGHVKVEYSTIMDTSQIYRGMTFGYSHILDALRKEKRGLDRYTFPQNETQDIKKLINALIRYSLQNARVPTRYPQPKEVLDILNAFYEYTGHDQFYFQDLLAGWLTAKLEKYRRYNSSVALVNFFNEAGESAAAEQQLCQALQDFEENELRIAEELSKLGIQDQRLVENMHKVYKVLFEIAKGFPNREK